MCLEDHMSYLCLESLITKKWHRGRRRGRRMFKLSYLLYEKEETLQIIRNFHTVLAKRNTYINNGWG
jgi:hypothetical protein